MAKASLALLGALPAAFGASVPVVDAPSPAVCSGGCVVEFANCFNFHKMHDPATVDAFAICEEQLLNNGLGGKCDPGCAYSTAMNNMKLNLCSPDCEHEFGICVTHHGMDSNAKDQCIDELRAGGLGHRCPVKTCELTATMQAYHAQVEDGTDGKGEPEIPPGTAPPGAGGPDLNVGVPQMPGPDTGAGPIPEPDFAVKEDCPEGYYWNYRMKKCWPRLVVDESKPPADQGINQAQVGR